MEKETKKMRFHVTITDNETGAALFDENACAIIAGINVGERSSQLTISACDGFALASTLAAAEGAAEQTYEENPELEPVAKLAKALRREAETEEPENNQ